MEFLRVTIKGILTNVPVLINGQKNGYTNKILKLNRGYVKVSAEYPKIKTEEIYLSDTTVNKPKKVILCA